MAKNDSKKKDEEAVSEYEDVSEAAVEEPVAKEEPSKHLVSELVENGEVITGRAHHLCAGAAAHKGWNSDTKVTQKEFIDAVEAFMNVEVFANG